MAKRLRKSKPSLREIIFWVIFAICAIPALSIPATLNGKFIALAIALTVAFVGTLAITGYLRDRFRPRFDSFQRTKSGANAGAGFEWPAERDADPESFQRLWKQISEDTQRHAASPESWSLDLLKKLEWRRFEEVCAAYFESLGFKAETTRFGADGGVDINLFAEGSSKPSIIVQCKAWNTNLVKVGPIRELLGVMTDQKVFEGIFVTSSQFSKYANEFARRNNIALIDGGGFLDKIESTLTKEQAAKLLAVATHGDFRTPTCPSCGIKMVSRTRKDGEVYWGCVNRPRCRMTFDVQPEE